MGIITFRNGVNEMGIDEMENYPPAVRPTITGLYKVELSRVFTVFTV